MIYDEPPGTRIYRPLSGREPNCTVCGRWLGLRDHDGRDHLACAAPGRAFNHIYDGGPVSLLRWLLRRVPRALCGVPLAAEPGPDAPACPVCLWHSEPWYTATPPFSWLFGGCEDARSNFAYHCSRVRRFVRHPVREFRIYR